MMTRRKMLGVLAGTTAALACNQLSGAPRPSAKRFGIGMHSYGFHWRAAKEKHAGAKFSDALEFLEYAHQIGAGGVQVTIGAKETEYARRIKAKAAEYGMYFEAQFSLPANQSDVARFENDIRLAREAGATLFRTACLGGRRYETFKSAEEFREFREKSWNSLALAEPILRHQRLRVAIENHKDWLVPEFLSILQRISSEWVGVCVDIGNNIALLEDAMEVVQALAPFAFSTHIKDMAVQETSDGFLLSEVPLGDGFLDLKRMIEVLEKANPAVQLNLEMITRDPLRISCLSDGYWATMQEASASGLARSLGMVKSKKSSKPLPKTTGMTFEQQLAFEDANVRACVKYPLDGGDSLQVQ
jgi:sugar phosphate isomerase/epimerase